MRKIRIIARSLMTRWDGFIPISFCAVWIIVACISCVYTPYPLNFTDGYHVWSKPSSQHILGTDGAGADILTWLMAGSATELLLVVSVVILTFSLGIMGIIVTLSRHRLVSVTSLICIDALISIPTVVIVLMCVAQWGASIAGVIIACSCAYSVNLVRVIRPIAHHISRQAFVTFARYKGQSQWQIFCTHILPHIMPSIIINISLSASTAILAESGLTYLGIGVPLHTASWGHSLAIAANFASVHPGIAIYPGVIITLAVIMINLLGDAIRESVDPLANPALRKRA